MQDMKTGGNGYCLMMYFGHSSQVLESIDRRDCLHHNEANETYLLATVWATLPSKVFNTSMTESLRSGRFGGGRKI